ncbi:MAG: hypothetical protein PVF65_04950 [Sphingomonadales bacterium]|jgi:hypothetical protein
MFRILWITTAALLSGAVAFFLTPILFSAIIPFFAENGALRDWQMIATDISIVKSMTLAIAALFFTAFGAMTLAIIDHRTVSVARHAITVPKRGGPQIKAMLVTLNGDGAFYDSAQAYSNSFREFPALEEDDATIKRSFSDAYMYFSPRHLSRTALQPVYFKAFAIALLISGVVLFLREWLSPSAAELLSGFQHGLIALTITTVTALVMLLVINGLLTWRRNAYDQLCRLLNRQFRMERLDFIEGAMNEMRQSLVVLEEQSKTTSKENSENVDKVISTALKSFIDDLNKVQSKELAGVEQRLKAVAEAAQSLDRSYTDSLKQTSKTIADTLKDLKSTQSQSYSGLVKSQEKAANALKASIEKNYKTIESVISNASKSLEKASQAQAEVAIKGLNPTISELEKISSGMNEVMRRMADSLESLAKQQANITKSFNSEDTAAKVIENAANDMIAASKASRETVERFIALAERMRAITTTLRTAKSTNGKSEVNKETARRLSAALRDLKEHVED